MKVGDKVVYIMKSLPDIGLVNGKIYTILSTENCLCKDGLCIDVGITQDKFTVCGHCYTIINMDDRWMFDHTGFRLADENDLFIEKHLAIIKEKTERYKKLYQSTLK